MNNYFTQRTACPCCESRHLRLLREAPYAESPIREYLDEFYKDVGRVDHACLAGATYRLMECADCALVFQAEVPKDALLGKLYEEWMDPQRVYDLYERAHGINHYTFLARQVESAIRHFGAKPATLKFLDFGMGWGDWSALAAAYGCQSFGLEVSATRIRHAQARGIRVLNTSELAAHEFDLINAEQVFEHVPNPQESLRLLKSRLRPGGLIWISVPDGADIKARLERWDWNAPKDSEHSLNAVAPLEHLNCFTHKTLVLLGQRVGLRPQALDVKRKPAGQNKPAPLWRWRRMFGGESSRGQVADDSAGTSMYFTPA